MPDPVETTDPEGVDFAWVMQTTFVLTVLLGAPIVALASIPVSLPTWGARASFAIRVGAIVWIVVAVGAFLYARRNAADDGGEEDEHGKDREHPGDADGRGGIDAESRTDGSGRQDGRGDRNVGSDRDVSGDRGDEADEVDTMQSGEATASSGGHSPSPEMTSDT